MNQFFDRCMLSPADERGESPTRRLSARSGSPERQASDQRQGKRPHALGVMLSARSLRAMLALGLSVLGCAAGAGDAATDSGGSGNGAGASGMPGSAGASNGSAAGSPSTPNAGTGGVDTGSAGNGANAGASGGGQPAGGGAPGNAGTANAGTGNGGAPNPDGLGFDRLLNCTGGPYANPLPQATLTATAVPGSETDGAAGFQTFEGPVWFEGALYFSHLFADAPNLFPSSVRRLTAANTIETFIENSGSNGLAIDIDGSLLAATHDTQSVSRFDFTTKARSTVVDMFGGQPFNSPNDLAVRSDGTIYFTDPNWQNAGRASVGVVQLYRVAPDMTVTAVTTPFQPGGDGGPNGVALSPDETTLYVGGNGAPGGGQIAAYPVDGQGNLGTPVAFPPGASSVADSDGMTLDCAGNLYVAQNNAVTVYAPSGTLLGTVAPAAGIAANMAFGGPSGTTLYITSQGQGIAQLSSVSLNVPGLPY